MRYRLVSFIIMLTIVIGLSAQVSFAYPQKLVIGGDFNFPPYEYLDANSLPDGYNVELSRAICRQLNLEPEFRLAKWALVVQWLENDEIDLVDR
ncbi:MAG: transporter substrate-binding domain-containing protein, partial [Candidatus Cloacimonas sp.]|nr:transporter substrate-binding domain-containing protein [Candidatus Cloacimonas sp.]